MAIPRSTSRPDCQLPGIVRVQSRLAQLAVLAYLLVGRPASVSHRQLDALAIPVSVPGRRLSRVRFLGSVRREPLVAGSACTERAYSGKLVSVFIRTCPTDSVRCASRRRVRCNLHPARDNPVICVTSWRCSIAFQCHATLCWQNGRNACAGFHRAATSRYTGREKERTPWMTY